jgi:hypothetical protein
VRFDITDQLMIRFSAFIGYCTKNESTMRHYISAIVLLEGLGKFKNVGHKSIQS